MLGVLSNGASVILNASITADMGLPGFGKEVGDQVGTE